MCMPAHTTVPPFFTARNAVGVADATFCFAIPEGYPDLQAAPLFCAGLIGYRALKKAGDANKR